MPICIRWDMLLGKKRIAVWFMALFSNLVVSAARPFEDGCSRWEELYQFFYPRHLSSAKDLCVRVMSSLLGICESWTRLRRMANALTRSLSAGKKIPHSPSALLASSSFLANCLSEKNGVTHYMMRQGSIQIHSSGFLRSCCFINAKISVRIENTINMSQLILSAYNLLLYHYP